MNYVINDGIFLRTVCGENFLVNIKKRPGESGYIKQISDREKVLFMILSKDTERSHAVADLVSILSLEESKAENLYDSFTGSLLNHGFIRREEL